MKAHITFSLEKVPMTDQEEYRALIELGMPESAVREMQAIKNGEIKGDVVRVETPAKQTPS